MEESLRAPQGGSSFFTRHNLHHIAEVQQPVPDHFSHLKHTPWWQHCNIWHREYNADLTMLRAIKPSPPFPALLLHANIPIFVLIPTSTRWGATRLQQRIRWSNGRDLLRTILSMASPSRNKWSALLLSCVDFTSPTRSIRINGS